MSAPSSNDLPQKSLCLIAELKPASMPDQKEKPTRQRKVMLKVQMRMAGQASDMERVSFSIHFKVFSNRRVKQVSRPDITSLPYRCQKHK
ncbi:hypothetical protein FAGAP_4936 [Fusarium agapanthi]|uniref:Uncharacterized protein n=1 Tax=Fusarium agapanthi TaxID=1803897 RepID=A0A9P5EFK7_9HYPO|nr:hypothetical protein FAGAP_4936 [Fusarium agapanthi]